MAHSTEENLLEKLLKSRYPLTNYLNRQQQFTKTFASSTGSTGSMPTVPSTSEPTKPAAGLTKSRPLKPSSTAKSSFNVPDTLDPFASEYEQMNSTSRIDDENSQEYDETLLLKNINEISSDNINDLVSSMIKRSSTIQLEFSPLEFENNSPLQRAIQSGLSIINK